MYAKSAALSAFLSRACGSHVCSLFAEGDPPDGRSFGVRGTIAKLVGRWLDEGRLPDPLRAVPKVGKELR